jgi:hypothetical protein
MLDISTVEGFVADHKGLFLLLAIVVFAISFVPSLKTAFVGWGIKMVSAVLSNATTPVAVVPVAGAAKIATPIATPFGNDEALVALQNLTVQAVKSGSPELLAKVTALYQDFQKAAKEGSTA